MEREREREREIGSERENMCHTLWKLTKPKRKFLTHRRAKIKGVCALEHSV